jgi:hypothetical protein
LKYNFRLFGKSKRPDFEVNENSENDKDAESARDLSDDLVSRFPSVVAIEDFKLTYFPVPRAGNTSTKIALAKALGYSLEELGRSRWPHSTREQGVHSTEIVKWGASPSDYSDSYAFTIVRHPVSRLISAWSLLIVEQDPHLWAMGLGPPAELLISYEELQSWSSVISKFQTFLDSKYFQHLRENDVHFQPQVNFFPPGLANVFKIEDGLDELAKTLRLCTKDDSLSLTEKVNRSLFCFGVTELPQETIEHAHRICSDDIAALGYSRLILPAERNQARPVFVSDTEFALFHAIRERNQRILALWEELNNVVSQANETISPEGN